MNRFKLVFHSFLAALLILPLALLSGSIARAQKSRSGVRAEMLVSTDWLARNLNKPGVVVLHAAAERKSYDEGHVPGARFLSLREILTVRNGVANELPPVADLRNVFERLGVGDQSRIVIYGENAGLTAARVYFTLDYLGHGDRAALLDGGLEKWRAEKREVSTQAVAPQSAAFTPRVRPQVRAEASAVRDLSWIASNIEPSDVSLIDARPLKQYEGEDAGGLSRPGHIPGAASLYWMQHLAAPDNPVLKPARELQALFEAAGVKPGQRVLTYCRSGMQASHSYFTAKYLGYDVMMYDGSFGEWVTLDGAPVVKGKERK
ncbi:MAG: sulfurtransferase [Blastocatellia bacterium]